MKTIWAIAIGIICINLSGSISQCAEETKTFVAFSLKAAQKHMEKGDTQEKQAILRLGYITRLIGAIVDPVSRDCILIGEMDPGLPEIHLDDLVVILRSVFLYGDREAPGVTIEPSEQDPRHKPQRVRYFGHTEGTRVGFICFHADYLMKKIGLKLMPSYVDGVLTYFDLAVDEAKKTGGRNTEVLSRFWYYPVVARVVSVGNGVLVEHCELAVLTEVLSANVDGKPVQDLERFYDRPSELFAQSFSDHLDKLANSFQTIRELRSLTTLAAVSRGLARTDVQPDIGYWLHGYRLPLVETPTEVDVLRNSDQDIGFEVYGGVYLQALSMRLKGGDLTGFTEAVLQARPSSDALTWEVVLTPEKEIFIPLPPDARSAVEAYARADYLFQSKQYDLAIANWFQVARTYPQMGEVYYRIAMAFERKGMMACAADYYTKALELDPFLRNVKSQNPSEINNNGKR